MTSNLLSGEAQDSTEAGYFLASEHLLVPILLTVLKQQQ